MYRCTRRPGECVRVHRYTMSKQSGSEWLRYQCTRTHSPRVRVHRYTMSKQSARTLLPGLDTRSLTVCSWCTGVLIHTRRIRGCRMHRYTMRKQSGTSARPCNTEANHGGLFWNHRLPPRHLPPPPCLLLPLLLFSANRGYTLHFTAQPEPFLSLKPRNYKTNPTISAHVKPKSGLVEAPTFSRASISIGNV